MLVSGPAHPCRIGRHGRGIERLEDAVAEGAHAFGWDADVEMRLAHRRDRAMHELIQSIQEALAIPSGRAPLARPAGCQI